MPETGPTQLQLFPDSAVTGTGRLLPYPGQKVVTGTGEPRPRPLVVADEDLASPQTEQLPFDSDVMRQAA
ncbi:hypothetical protein [Streptomyces noursei]|uniref:hypothetical protein n=1 Tax=Streptomyces noursei TaxID=1971 RepID=UPI0035DE8D6C